MQTRRHGMRSLRAAARAVVETLEQRRLMAGVVINEFLADNNAGIVDQDNDHSDWIEIRNTDQASVNLAGWSLTDDAGNLTKWQFPSTTLAGNSYLLVYASGKNRAVTGQQLHTNFALDNSGEYLALVKPGGIIADSYAPFPAQLKDVSYGHGSTSTVVDTLVGEAATVKAKVPTSASAIDATWRGPSFAPDGTWLSGLSGVGYDTSTGGTNYNPLIRLNVQSLMSGTGRTSIYTRMSFDVADPSALSSLLLRMRYDDGFIAYLNGVEIGDGKLRQFFAASATPAWNSIANGMRDDADGIVYQDFDITSDLDLLVPGTNVLAIHGLNVSNSSDLILSPLLTANRSLGTADGFMATPTPGAVNTTGTLGFVADTNFSVDRGFFDAPFDVAITTATPGAQIRYTLDGKLPTATTGTVYTSPITISTTRTLRAAAFKPGWTSTDVDTQTYIFLHSVIQQNGTGLPAHANWGHSGPDWEMDPNIVNNATYSGTIINDLKAVPTISLVMPWSDWFGSGGQGIYPTGSGIERATSVEMISAHDSSVQFQIDAAVEIQGASSTQRWNEDKLSMRLTFKPPYGPTKLKHAIFKDPVLDKNAATQFDRLILDAMYDDSWMDPSLSNRQKAKQIQDQFAADLQNLAGGYGPHARFVHLYLNGLYWGMYYLHEETDDSFAEEYLGGDKEDYNVVKHNGSTVVSGGSAASSSYSSMISAVRQNMTVAANYNNVAAKLEIDDFIDYMLVNYYIGNIDWADHNWYASQNRVDPAGRWRFHSWDAELSLRDVNTDVTGENESGSPTEIHTRLLANPEYKLKFADHVQEMLFNGGVLATAGQTYIRRLNEIHQAMVGESARWGDNHGDPALTRNGWRTFNDGMQSSYFALRGQKLIDQMTARNWLPTLGAPSYSQHGGTVSPGYQLTIAKPASSPAGAVIYYTLDGSDPRLTGGAISGAATPYTAPITLNVARRVKARILNGTTWSAVLDATFLMPTLFPVRISELHYHPDNRPGVADPEDMEFIELLNTGSATVNLQGVQINGAIDPYTFGNINLAAGQRIVVARTPAIFDQVYGGGINRAATGYGGKLDNAGEALTLLGPLGETLQTFTYSDNAPWPSTPDGDGPSLEIIDPLGDPNDPANWRASFVVGGTPGIGGAPPTLLTATFHHDSAYTLRAQFDHDMDPSSITPGDLDVWLQPGGTLFHPTSLAFIDARTVAFTFVGLADGNYHATIAAGVVKDLAGVATTAATDLDFFVLAGDANRDRHVDGADQAILTAHLGQAGTFADGDFDHSGTVDAADQTILNQKMSLWLPAVGAASLPVTGGNDVYRLRRESASVLEIFAGADAAATYRLMLSAVTQLNFIGGAGDDTLVIDLSNGLPLGAIATNFDGGNAGADTLKLIGTSGPDSVTWDAATLAFGATMTYAGVESRIFDGGGGFDNLTIDAIPVTFPASQQFQSLSLTGAARAALPAGGDKLLITRSLLLDSTAQLDLADNNLVIDYDSDSPIGSWNGSHYTGVIGHIASGYNGGVWTGSGIVTSAATDHFTTLAVAEALQVLGPAGGIFRGASVDATAVLVKFTYGGDANLDGKLNIDDYIRIDQGIAAQQTAWSNGDFNYDGTVNIDDYTTIIDSNIPNQGPPFVNAAAAPSIFAAMPGRIWADSADAEEDEDRAGYFLL